MKWVVAEVRSTQAEALLRDAIRDRRRILTPPHLTSEVVNTLYRRTLWASEAEGRLTLDTAEAAVRSFLGFPLTSVGSPELYQRAFTLAHATGLSTISDALSVALADLLQVPLWTDDRRLINALATFPLVRRTGSYAEPAG